MFIRITGRETSGSGSTAVPGYFYSGVEQWSYLDGTIVDAPTGAHFFSNLNPLVEMAMMDTVPVDALALATRSASGDHWEFLWEGDMGSGSSVTACHCCCCCVPCGSQIWLTIGQMRLLCGTPALPLDTFGFTFPLTKQDSCWKGSVTQANPGAYGDGTTTVSAMVCCDPNDLRHCPVLTVKGTTTISSGTYRGTYKWCIGPIDVTTIINCVQSDPVYSMEGTTPAVNWQGTITFSDWLCDPNGEACGCQYQPGDGQSITLECLCRSCPISGQPDTFPAHAVCSTPSGSFDVTFTMNYYPSVSATGSPCSAGGDDFGQGCWFGESGPDDHGCRFAFLLLCKPDAEDLAYITCTIADEGGDCSTLNEILASCWNLPGQSSKVCCNPWGVAIKNAGGFTILTLGTPPTCPD